MASKALYTVVAVVGIAAASGAAWWYQNKLSSPATDSVAAAPAPRGAASGPGGAAGRPPGVEVARVETMRLTDDTPAAPKMGGAPISNKARQQQTRQPEPSGAMASAFAKLKR
mgnify:CR=1 FL=1